MAESAIFTTPVGRLVAGSLYKGMDKDAEGRPLVVKTGASAGQPRLDYYFAVAIPKTGESHWNQTAWGKTIHQIGQQAFPAGQWQHPSFAWKVIDGDSTIPNKKGKTPVSREGFKGHWVLNFSSGYAPKIFNSNGTAPLTEQGHVKLGYYVQVNCSVAGNGSQTQPGVYLNHNMVAFAAFGPEIIVGPDPTEAGFGQSPLPAGASATPIGAMPVAAPAPSAQYPAAAPPPPITPNHAFVQGPPQRQMLPAANGATYEQMIAAGWNDVQLVQHGMMAG